MGVIAPSDVAFDAKFPVVVIGAGAAGLIAALRARAEGVDVLVIERDAVPRGSTALSAGLIPAAGTRWQDAAGVGDSAAIFTADIMRKAHNTPDPDLAALAASEVGPTLEWLHAAHGLDFSLVRDFRYPGHSAHRMHGLASRSGLELIDRLRAAAEAVGVEILCNAHSTDLVADAKRVFGVAIVRPDGSSEMIGCGALVLACNGYGGNRDLVRRHIPHLTDALYFGHPGNQGDAVFWGQALGADIRHLSGHQGHGSVAHPVGILITWATITDGGVQVNADGRRFSNEAAGYSEQAAKVLAQPNGLVWTIFDQRIADIAGQFEDFRQAEAAGAIVRADRLDALAAMIGLDLASFSQTMAEVAALKISGGMDSFGRNFAGVAQLAAPFCAVQVTGALFHTQGGLVIDCEARVLRQDGTPFDNLFAAGGAACGVSGPDAAGYLSGNGLLTAVAFGSVAGRKAAGLLFDGR